MNQAFVVESTDIVCFIWGSKSKPIMHTPMEIANNKPYFQYLYSWSQAATAVAYMHQAAVVESTDIINRS